MKKKDKIKKDSVSIKPVNRKLDTNTDVFFYEQEFYPLSNFSSFTVKIGQLEFLTAEHAYQFAKFRYGTISLPAKIESNRDEIAYEILNASSAHEAFTIARKNEQYVRPDWVSIKLDVMKNILRTKLYQHEYVLKKLIDTNGRTLIEDSWRDSFWGWGEDKLGNNWLGRLWEEIRDDLIPSLCDINSDFVGPVSSAISKTKFCAISVDLEDFNANSLYFNPTLINIFEYFLNPSLILNGFNLPDCWVSISSAGGSKRLKVMSVIFTKEDSKKQSSVKSRLKNLRIGTSLPSYHIPVYNWNSLIDVSTEETGYEEEF